MHSTGMHTCFRSMCQSFCPGGHAWQEGAAHGRGNTCQGGMHSRGQAWQGHAWQESCMAGKECKARGKHGRGHAWWGVYGKGCVWQGDMCPECLHGRGHAWQGDEHGRGMCVAEETATEASDTHPTGMYSCL